MGIQFPQNFAVPFLVTSTVYGVVRRASRKAIVAPHSLYTLLCVVSFGVLVDLSKYMQNRRGVTNSGRWYVISRKVAFAKRDSTCRRQLHPNGLAMVSTGIKSSELSIKHLAKTFYFVLSFLF